MKTKKKLVGLTREHADIFDMLGEIHFHLPRTTWAYLLIAAGLPMLVEEIAKLHPEHTFEIGVLRHAVGAPTIKIEENLRPEKVLEYAAQPKPPAGVIDFATRSAALLRKRQQQPSDPMEIKDKW